MPHVTIEDARSPEDFAGISFSMYKRSQVKKSLVDAMYKGSIEEANYWAAELICCGCFLELWEVILEFLGRNIYTANPKLPVIIARCFTSFKNIATSDFATSQLEMRNSSRIRRVFAEVVTMLCLSRKKSKIEYVKIDKDNDFDIVRLSSRLKAPSTDFATNVIKNEDPSEIFVAVNELCFNLSKNVRNPMMAEYWVEWLLEYEKRCRKKKERCQCKRREFAPQGDDSGLDISFLLWDAMFTEAKLRSQKVLTTILLALLDLFKIRFTAGTKRKRRHLLYFAISLLCEPLDLSIAAIDNHEAIEAILHNLDVIYSQVKQSEVHQVVAKEPKPSQKEKQPSNPKFDILLTMGID